MRLPRLDAFTAAQLLAGGTALTRLARGRDRLPPLARGRSLPDGARVSAVIPARDEEHRLAGCLAGLRDDPDVAEIVVVDDESRDGTAALARRYEARVVGGRPLPPGWVGKPWALDQGLRAARGDWILALDADVRPRAGLAAGAVAAAVEGGYDLVSAGARFRCDGVAETALHASMLATLVYRFGPPGGRRPPRPARTLVNGQCLLARRKALLATGGFGVAPYHLVDDVALGRALAARGWRVALLDGGGLLEVDMHSGAADVWREWGRTLPLSGVASRREQVADLAVLWLAMALPAPRLLARRGTPVDAALLAARLALLAGLRGAYARPGLGVWCSPLADLPSVVRLTAGVVRPGRTWRGRRYPLVPPASGRATAVAASCRQGRGGEPQPDQRQQGAGGRHVDGRGEGQLQYGRGEDPEAGTHRERPRRQGHPRAQRHAQGERRRAQDGEPAHEHQDRTPAPEAGEDRPRVPDHGGADGDVRHPAVPGGTRHGGAEQPGERPLERVSREDRRGAGPAEPLLHVPEPGVAVAEGARVESVPAPDEHGHRHRSEQVAPEHGKRPRRGSPSGGPAGDRIGGQPGEWAGNDPGRGVHEDDRAHHRPGGVP